MWTLHEVVATSAPVEPVTLADIKDALRVSHDMDDYFLTEAITAAREYLEVELEESLVSRSYTWMSDGTPGADELCLPIWPVSSLTSITYYDASNISQTFASTNYETDLKSRPARVRVTTGVSWPAVYDRYDAFTVTFTAGYVASVRLIPVRVQQLLRIIVADLYEHRESNIEQRLQENMGYKRLLWSAKRVTFV